MHSTQLKAKIFLTISLLSASAFAKPIKTDDISNMLITGENRLRVNAPTIQVAWSPDVYRDFAGFLKDPLLVGSLTSPAISEPVVGTPHKLAIGKTALPWQSFIHEAPVLTVSVKKGKQADTKTAPKVDWTFLVKDSQGRVFYEKKQHGIMPDIVEWDGMGTSGVPLEVGFDYAYSLSIVDEAGNPQRYSGKPFSLNAFRYSHSGNTVTALTTELLFVDPSSVKFSPAGKRALAEVKDFLRTRYTSPLEIAVYELDAKFALARANAIVKYLSAEMEYADGRLKASGFSLNEKKGYRHVEIITK